LVVDPAIRHGVEGLAQQGQRGGTVGGMGDQLGDHRVIPGGDLVTLADPRIHPHGAALESGGRGKGEVGEPAGRRQEAALGILGIEPGLDGMAVDPQVALGEGQGFAGRDAQLQFDEIKAGDRLGNRMFDLQARVHLHEPETVLAQRAGAVGDELDRARAPVADARAAWTAASVIAARTGSVMPGAGASSITFWWRRCSEQSRS
jgi:hypothetical protein